MNDRVKKEKLTMNAEQRALGIAMHSIQVHSWLKFKSDFKIRLDNCKFFAAEEEMRCR